MVSSLVRGWPAAGASIGDGSVTRRITPLAGDIVAVCSAVEELVVFFVVLLVEPTVDTGVASKSLSRDTTLS